MCGSLHSLFDILLDILCHNRLCLDIFCGYGCTFADVHDGTAGHFGGILYFVHNVHGILCALSYFLSYLKHTFGKILLGISFLFQKTGCIGIEFIGNHRCIIAYKQEEHQCAECKIILHGIF